MYLVASFACLGGESQVGTGLLQPTLRLLILCAHMATREQGSHAIATPWSNTTRRPHPKPKVRRTDVMNVVYLV